MLRGMTKLAHLSSLSLKHASFNPISSLELSLFLKHKPNLENLEVRAPHFLGDYPQIIVDCPSILCCIGKILGKYHRSHVTTEYFDHGHGPNRSSSKRQLTTTCTFGPRSSQRIACRA